MHDPKSVAHEIYLPFKDKNGDKIHFLTIWHNDPETDGTDDSCGWFLRLRHVKPDTFKDVLREYEFNFKHNYWFSADGLPIFSTQGIVLNMYKAAAWKVFYPNRKRYNKFMRKHLFDIMSFAENPTDSLHTSITEEYHYRLIEHDRSKVDSREERIRHFASVVYTDIMRKLRPWYQHPKWHIHHWSFQFHPYQQLKRRFWDKCTVCKKRGFKNDYAISDGSGGNLRHGKCSQSSNPVLNTPTHDR